MLEEINLIPYPNIISFMKRHGLTREDIGNVIGKSRKNATDKLNQRKTKNGKVICFDIFEADALIDFVKCTEREYLKKKFGETWETEWASRWGHINDWFKYLFFDQMVPNVTLRKDRA